MSARRPTPIAVADALEWDRFAEAGDHYPPLVTSRGADRPAPGEPFREGGKFAPFGRGRCSSAERQPPVDQVKGNKNYKYVGLDDLLQIARPLLSSHGLAITQPVGPASGEIPQMRTEQPTPVGGFFGARSRWLVACLDPGDAAELARHLRDLRAPGGSFESSGLWRPA